EQVTAGGVEEQAGNLAGQLILVHRFAASRVEEDQLARTVACCQKPAVRAVSDAPAEGQWELANFHSCGEIAHAHRARASRQNQPLAVRTDREAPPFQARRREVLDGPDFFARVRIPNLDGPQIISGCQALAVRTIAYDDRRQTVRLRLQR